MQVLIVHCEIMCGAYACSWTLQMAFNHLSKRIRFVHLNRPMCAFWPSLIFLFFLDNRFQFLRFAWLNFGVMCVSRQRCTSTAPYAAAAQSGASSAEEHIADARVLPKCLCVHVWLVGWWFSIHNNATPFLVDVCAFSGFVSLYGGFIFVKWFLTSMNLKHKVSDAKLFVSCNIAHVPSSRLHKSLVFVFFTAGCQTQRSRLWWLDGQCASWWTRCAGMAGWWKPGTTPKLGSGGGFVHFHFHLPLLIVNKQF